MSPTALNFVSGSTVVPATAGLLGGLTPPAGTAQNFNLRDSCRKNKKKTFPTGTEFIVKNGRRFFLLMSLEN